MWLSGRRIRLSRWTIGTASTPFPSAPSCGTGRPPSVSAAPSFRTTDDCGTVLRYLPDTPVYVVEGDVANMKLTYQEDVFLLERLYQLHHA